MLFQGKNVDALIIYFGEDPARCPFEQGICYLQQFCDIVLFISDEQKLKSLPKKSS
jgi:hypothetical protein